MPDTRVPPEFDAFLAEPRNAILCVARGPGRPPHATPVWFEYCDGAFRVSTVRATVKYRLLLDAPDVTLVIDDPSTYQTVIVSGRASVVDDDASLVALRRTLRAKYGDYPGPASDDDEELARALREEGRVVITVEPDQVVSWTGGN